MKTKSSPRRALPFAQWYSNRVWAAAALAASFLGAAATAGDLTTNAEFLPASADLRPKFKELGLSRREQGSRGTCSVFTMIGALEFAAGKKLGHADRLSVEFLNWSANQSRPPGDGGFFSEMWTGFSKHGVCAEALMPYQRDFDASKKPASAAVSDATNRMQLGLQHHWIKPWDVQTGLTDAQLAAIKSKLNDGWPVCGGFRWPSNQVWIEGVLQMCPATNVYDGHSVLLVGYRDDVTQAGGGIFFFRNSNASGDGAMPYAYAKAYMNDALWIDFPNSGNKPGSPAGSSASSVDSGSAAIFRGPLGALATPPVGRNRRVSSNEQPNWNDANMDMTVLPPGKVLELPKLNGPGVITHMWFTSHAGRVNELNALSIRIYWDDRTEPGVEAPLGDFFAVGQGKPAAVESVPVQVSPSGALSCYWRMPFAKSARIVISNDNPDRTAGLYWQVDWTELPELPPQTAYFHAQYRQEYPAKPGDYLLADLQGAGQYVGTVMSVTLGQDGWWGEGDDFFYIDGEAVPSLQGTGGEDYFNDAWGFRQRTGNWFGQPRWQGDWAGDSGVAYRWHVLDQVNFTNSLKVTIEHKGNHYDDYESFFIERPDFLNSVAFWYQTGEPKRFGNLPSSYHDRRVPWRNYQLVKSFLKTTATGAAKPQVQFAGMFGARPVIAWNNTEANAKLTFPFEVEKSGRHALRLNLGVAPEFGICQIAIDDKMVATNVNLHAADYDELDLGLGIQELAAGPHKLILMAADQDAKPLAVEMLRLLPLPPEARRPVMTDQEAHFIRLYVGRAIYAHRLAYGKLPDKLETLVSTGLMGKRFLLNENQKPLIGRRDGDKFVVESPYAPMPWTNSWQGLDARR